MSLYYNVCGVHVGVTSMLCSGIGWSMCYQSMVRAMIWVALYSSFFVRDVQVEG